MEHKRTLSNVAFGGAWSEKLIDDERIMDAVRIVRDAVRNARAKDARGPELDAALGFIEATVDKGAMLVSGFRKACAVAEPAQRAREMRRYLDHIETWAGVAHLFDPLEG